MKEYFTKGKEWVSRTIPYSLPIKIIIGSLFGSGLLGLLSEFATYSYAISYGFRPPVEGIPYLAASVTFISIIVISGALIGFILIYTLLKAILIYTSFFLNGLKFNKKTSSIHAVLERMRKRPTFNLFIITIFSSLVIGVIFTMFIGKLEGFNTISEFLYLFPAFFLLSCFVYLTIFRPTYIKYIAGIGVFIFVVLVPSMMFHADTYGKFMRISGFGGGKEVSVFYDNLSKDSSQEQVSGGLLIRTANFVIIYKVENDEIIEIPISNISKITYKNTKNYILPKNI